jgi:acyl-CoA thioester hydrolase
MDKKHFKHTTEIRVRNYEVDWQGILHNAVYLQYFEIGRIEYLKQLGARIDLNSIRGESKVVLVRNEIDYKAPVHFDELVTIHTRIAFIKNSSFIMEGMMERPKHEEIVATNIAYHVWLDPQTDRPRTVGDEFRKLVQSYEGASCDILWPTRDT